MKKLPQVAVALVCGATFGFGLAISGMLDPMRVRGFLDVFGRWDPSLAFVLAGAVLTSFVGVRLSRLRPTPVCAERYEWPVSSRIDGRLVAGSAIFGVGWGLSGLCPGPVMADLAFGGVPVIIFAVAMVAGMALAKMAEIPAPRSQLRAR